MSHDINNHIQNALNGRNLKWPAEDVLRIIEDVQASMEQGVDQTPHLLKELTDLAKFIQKAKADIASIRPDEIKSKHIPGATDELDAVVGATEEATGAIMDACEKIQSLVEGQDRTLANDIVGQVTAIFEACSFQDITGQRIRKVVRALQEIDGKVIALLHAFGAEDMLNLTPSDDTRQGDERLLNGPQLDGQGVSQDDIDKLF
jgi:chemotaxis protein CheZ